MGSETTDEMRLRSPVTKSWQGPPQPGTRGAAIGSNYTLTRKQAVMAPRPRPLEQKKASTESAKRSKVKGLKTKPAAQEKTKKAAEKTVMPQRAPAKRKPRVKPPPPRMRARWGIFNNAMNQVAIFDYSQRAAADAKLAQLRADHKGLYYMQVVKDEMPAPVSQDGPA